MNGIQEAQMSGVAPSVSPIIGIEKRCPTCKELRPRSDFYKSGYTKDGLKSLCKKCLCKKSVERRKRNHDWYKEYNHRWRKENPEKMRECKRRWNKTHVAECRAMRNKAAKKKLKTPQGRLGSRMSNSIRKSLLRAKNNYHWEALVGYAADDLKKHLEKQFKEGMTWEKFLNGEIHIDHIIPKSVFNYEKPEDEDFKRCWALKNLQPLWAKENITKQDKLEKHFQPKFVFKGAI